MEHKIKADEKEHALDGQNKMNSFRKEKKHCDFIIKVESEEISVHRNVICSRSDYFDAMFSHDTKEKRNGVAEIKGVDRESTVKCVDFMYTGETSITEDKCGDLMHVATLFQLLTLCNAIAAFLEKKLDCKSFFATKQLAELYSCQRLVDSCNDFGLKHLNEISKLPDFKLLDKEYVEFLTGSNYAKAKEAVKCKSIIGWIKHSTSNRKSLLLEFMQKLDLTKIPLSYRSYLLEFEPLIYSSAEVARKFGLSCLRSMNVRSKDFEEDDKRLESKGGDDDDDSDIDLFGSDDEEESAKRERIREERLAQYAAKKAKKPGAIVKSSIILDVKPWDDETNMKKMEQCVRSIVVDGLLWGSAKLLQIGYGMKKLQISCVVEKDKVGTDFLEEEITKFEDLVQSVDIVAFNKI